MTLYDFHCPRCDDGWTARTDSPRTECRDCGGPLDVTEAAEA